MMKFLYTLSKLILGVVFIFSGFVKAIDPLGSAFKFEDYFVAFHLGSLEVITLPLAVILSSLEFIIGFSLFLGIRMRLASRLVALFMVFFTLLTLYIAVRDPVSDCGCFGDALILTNWQTFYKNLILMVFTAIVYISRNKFYLITKGATEWALISAGIVFITGLSIYCIRHLPIIDFRPYNVGTYIPDKMIIPEGAPADKFETYLYYEKNGQVKEFTEDNYPWSDTTWKFVDSRSILVEKGYQPPIHDFGITTSSGEDITDLVLSDNHYSFLLISYDLTDASDKGLLKFKKLYEQLKDGPYAFYGLASTASEYINPLIKRLELPYAFFAMDETTLKTIIRSNPGLVLLKEGIIIGKWHYNDFPEAETLTGHTLANLLTNYKKHQEGLQLMNLILYFFIFLSLFQLIRQFFLMHKP